MREEPGKQQETSASLGTRLRKQGRTRIDKQSWGSACAAKRRRKDFAASFQKAILARGTSTPATRRIPHIPSFKSPSRCLPLLLSNENVMRSLIPLTRPLVESFFRATRLRHLLKGGFRNSHVVMIPGGSPGDKTRHRFWPADTRIGLDTSRSGPEPRCETGTQTYLSPVQRASVSIRPISCSPRHPLSTGRGPRPARRRADHRRTVRRSARRAVRRPRRAETGR
jgi:hypothetical protein